MAGVRVFVVAATITLDGPSYRDLEVWKLGLDLVQTRSLAELEPSELASRLDYRGVEITDVLSQTQLLGRKLRCLQNSLKAKGRTNTNL